MAGDKAPDVAALEAEIDRLTAELQEARKREFKFLGRTIPADIVAQIAVGRKLTAISAKNAKVGLHGDGGNLWLKVTDQRRVKGGGKAPAGRSWEFRHQKNGVQQQLALGPFKAVSLVEARARSVICRQLVEEGVNLQRLKADLATASSIAPPKALTFRQAAEMYIASHEATWRNEKHRQQWPSSLAEWVFPLIGDMDVRAIDTAAVMRVLKQPVAGPDGSTTFWLARPPTAKRVRGRIEMILAAATVEGHREGENPARWQGHLSAILAEKSKVARERKQPALPYDRMGEFWAALSDVEGIGAEALRFAILTGARSGEVRGATWREIDLAARIWLIPAERMKGAKEHKVPLSAEAITVLERMAQLGAKPASFVFPSPSSKMISDMTVSAVLRRMNRKLEESNKAKPLAAQRPLYVDPKQGDAGVVPHGFRSSFRDWASEQTHFASEAVELSLAHSIGSKVELAYRRGDQFEKRRNLMDLWGKYCVTLPSDGSNVSQFRGAARG